MKSDNYSSSSTDDLDTVPETSSPAYASRHPLTRAFDKFASLVTRWAGSPAAFCIAVLTVVAWVVTGPMFHYSDGWQLVINTGTTVVTFLMVFLIQQSENKDSVALHLKLNELLSSHRAASNQLIGIEMRPKTNFSDLQRRTSNCRQARLRIRGPQRRKKVAPPNCRQGTREPTVGWKVNRKRSFEHTGCGCLSTRRRDVAQGSRVFR